MRIEEMTAEDWKDVVGNDPVIILPWGATEAHASHLPLSSDTLQPQYIADRIAESLDNVLVAPAVPYGNHSSTKNMPGTISLTFDNLRALAVNILEEFIRQGAKRFVVISGHAGSAHLTALSEACKTVVQRNDAKIMFFTDYDIAERHPGCADLEGDGHAGMLETSRVMAISPDLVREDRPVGRYVSQGYMIVRDASICFPVGMAGDTARASAEFGQEVNGYIVDAVIEMIENDL